MMLALFPDVDPRTFQSQRLRIHLVQSDSVKGLTANRDCVVLVPTDKYICEGIYLIGEGSWQGLVHCERLFGKERKVLIKRQLPCSVTEDVLPEEWFAEHVLGFVVANVIVTNEEILRRATA